MGEKSFSKVSQRDSTEPILYGAIAVCGDGTFTTDRIPFCIIIEELKSEEVPARFREAVDDFVSYNSPNLPASDEVDLAFRLLGWSDDSLGYIFDDRRGGGAPYCGLRFFWTDEDAANYVSRQGFSAEELNWLWLVAVRLHTYEKVPPVRRQL